MDILPIDQQQGGEGARRVVSAASEAVTATAVRRPRTRLLSPSSLEEDSQQITAAASSALALLRRTTVNNRASYYNPCEISNDSPEGEVEENFAKLAVCGTSHYLCHTVASNPRERQQQEPLVIPFAYDVYYYKNQQDENNNNDASDIMAFVGESILDRGAAAMQLLDCATKSSSSAGGGGGNRHHRQLQQRRLLEEEYSSQHRLLGQEAAEDFTQNELDRFMGLALEANEQGIRSEGCSTSAAPAPAEGDAITDCLPVQSALTVYLKLSEQETADGVEQVPDLERLAIQESILSFLQTQMKNDAYIVPNSIAKVAYVEVRAPEKTTSSDTTTTDAVDDQNQQQEAIRNNMTPSSTTTSSSSEQTTMLIAVAACLLALVFFLVFFIWRRNKQHKKTRSAAASAVFKSPGDDLEAPGTPSVTTASQPGTPPHPHTTTCTATTTCTMTALTCGGGNDNKGIQSNHQQARRWGLANRDSLALVPQELEDVGGVVVETSKDDNNDEQSYRRTDSSSSEGGVLLPMSVVGAEHMMDHIDIDDGLSGFTLSTASPSELGGSGGDGVGDGNSAICGGVIGTTSIALDDNRNGQDSSSPPPISTFTVSMSDGFGTLSSGGIDGTSTYSEEEEEEHTDGASLSFITEVRTSTMDTRQHHHDLDHQGHYHASSSNDGDMQHNLEHQEVLSTRSYDSKKSAARRVLQMT